MHNKLIAYPTHWVGTFFWRGGGGGGVENYLSLGITVPIRDGNLTLFRVNMHEIL